MKYQPGQKLYVSLLSEKRWSGSKFALNHTFVTITDFAGYFSKDWDYVRSVGSKEQECYHISEDHGRYVWTLDDFDETLSCDPPEESDLLALLRKECCA